MLGVGEGVRILCNTPSHILERNVMRSNEYKRARIWEVVLMGTKIDKCNIYTDRFRRQLVSLIL